MSGSALSPLVSGLSNGRELAKQFADKRKCPLKPPSEMLHCLRKIPLQHFIESEVSTKFCLVNQAFLYHIATCQLRCCYLPFLPASILWPRFIRLICVEGEGGLSWACDWKLVAPASKLSLYILSIQYGIRILDTKNLPLKKTKRHASYPGGVPFVP